MRKDYRVDYEYRGRTYTVVVPADDYGDAAMRCKAIGAYGIVRTVSREGAGWLVKRMWAYSAWALAWAIVGALFMRWLSS
jgi:hypothetical protein